MERYSIKPGTRKFKFLSFVRNLYSKYQQQLLNTNTRTELNAIKTVFKEIFHKIAEKTRESIGKKISDKIAKPRPNLIWN